ncbi:GNAT family N-acetyltransferase [Flavivirga eckloniae]|uniref:GNAT family N-acetyltransferase n=1 Tax=Flavivirga eckloniae TaxID=1803846 RepID=A0A2K9PJK3_9FLAO|nr:GNAT family N-acetyltransferase [Flavivirga eckloniae]AUP77244.1 GNAT family N-acetyltransferase [Flavivirga eckloniae]
MKNNPFISKEFTSVWSKHFNKSKPEIRFKFIKDLSFVKNKYLPMYTNMGKNLTNGLSYKLQMNESDYKNKVFFIYDIPEYINQSNPETGSLKLKSVKQYKGYLANLDNYTNLDDYLADNFTAKSRRKFRMYKRRLEESFNIDYKMYYGDNMTKEQYDVAFDYFNKLLKKRYTEKRINNHYLAEKKWSYLREVCYPMILSKKASLFVIFDNNTPIAVSINYIADDIDFGALTVFDIDYTKFNIGFIDIMKHLEWCIENNIRIFDFSKGDFDYKKRWGNKIYNFDYHILYDSSSVIAKLIASSLAGYFSLKQTLREKDLHTRFHKLIFLLKGNKNTNTKNFQVIKDDNEIPENDLQLIDYNTDEYAFLKKIVYDLIFNAPEAISDVNVYLVKGLEDTYCMKGKKTNIKFKLSP